MFSMTLAAVAVKPFDHWYAARDRLLGSATFRRWAAKFPFTRGIAQRRARAVFDLCAGFVYSQVLLACVQLRLFDMLAERPQTMPVLARRLKLSEASAGRLLAAAVSLRLVDKRSGDRFGLGELGAAIVGNSAIVAMVEHHALLYADLRDPVALLQGQGKDTALADYWPYAGASRPGALTNDRVNAYSSLMSASQSLIADEVLAAYDFGRHRCLLDVGGGEGAFLTAVAAQNPDLPLILFDLPAVTDLARKHFVAAGLHGRTTAVGGDFLVDRLPRGADVISLVRVLHDHDDEGALKLMRAVHLALPANGTLVLAEPMAGTPGAEPMGDAYFGFYLLAMGRGRARSPAELERMLRAVGFARVRAGPAPGYRCRPDWSLPGNRDVESVNNY